MPKSWDELESYDEIIQPKERRIISELLRDSKKRCPHLRVDGKWFHYCGKDFPNVKKQIDPFHPIYTRAADTLLLSMQCLNNFESCCTYRGTLKHHDHTEPFKL